MVATLTLSPNPTTAITLAWSAEDRMLVVTAFETVPGHPDITKATAGAVLDQRSQIDALFVFLRSCVATFNN